MSTTTRQSNFELLRIISMFLILLLHANYLSFGFPTAEEVKGSFVSTFGRIYIEHLSIVAVNVYVLISGWFGIKPKLKGFVNLVVQVTTYSALLLVVWLLISGTKFSFGYLEEVVAVGSPYWFVISYMLLYLLSPVLNEFAEHATRKTFRIVLLSFFAFEIFYGTVFGLGSFEDGYSTVSFIGLYLLAKYLRKHGGRFMQMSIKQSFRGYFLTALVGAILYVVHLFVLGDRSVDKHIDYCGPFVLLSSVFLFVAFSKMRIQSVLINYCASSAFAVYLIHCNPHIIDYYTSCIRFVNYRVPGIPGAIVIFIVVAMIFFFCIMIDKLRLALTPTKLIEKICEKVSSKTYNQKKH